MADTDAKQDAKEQSPIQKAQADAEQARKGLKVVQQFPDGSSKETTAGSLDASHGDPMGGPTVGDLNPGFDPMSAAHNGAAK